MEDTLLFIQEEEVQEEITLQEAITPQQFPIDINLGSDGFKTFFSVLSFMAKSCADLTIRNGKIIQMSNRRSSIFFTDITSLLGNVDLLLSGLEAKVELLEPLKKQQVDVVLKIEENKYFIQDTYSQFQFMKPLERFMSNPYVPEETLFERLAIEGQSPIVEYKISKFLIDRLSALSKALAATMIRIDFEGGKADIKILAPDNNNSTVGKIVSIDVTSDLTGKTAFPIQPFLLTGDEVDITCYPQANENLVLKVSCKIDEIIIDIWCTSSIVRPDDETEEND